MTRGINTAHWKRYLSFRLLVAKVRENGAAWCIHAIWHKLWSSLDWRTRSIRAKLWRLPDNIQYRRRKQHNVLYAFYDLKVAPATFDIISFLVLAEAERKKVGCTSLHVVVVPGPDKGFRANDLEAYHKHAGTDYDIYSMRWRLKNILLPCCWLIPSCQQATVCASREEAQAFHASLVKHTFPTEYTVRFPKDKYLWKHIVATVNHRASLPSIKATPQARRFVSDWIQLKIGGRKVITITLRECSYQHDRNSKLEAWGAFARSLDTSIYLPVVVRDTEAAFKPLPSEISGLTIFTEASWNIELRAALYEMSYLNMSVDNGPFALCIFNRRVAYLLFKVITPYNGDEWYRSQGVEYGSQLKFQTPFQRWIWEDDRLEVIQKEFRQMCQKIEKASKEKFKTEQPLKKPS